MIFTHHYLNQQEEKYLRHTYNTYYPAPEKRSDDQRISIKQNLP